MKINNHDHPLYSTWMSMRNRCSNPNNSRYEDWGGRGIKVCKRWDDFSLFAKDMGERPEGCTLDRIDNSGDYTPENCKWSTFSEQSNNKRILVTNKSGYNGVCFVKKSRNWNARITIEGIRYEIGRFESALYAYLQYCKVYLEWYGYYPKEYKWA